MTLRAVLIRIATTLITLLGVAIIVFVTISLAPGDPIAMMLPPGASQADMDRLRALYGLDKSIPAAILHLDRPGAARRFRYFDLAARKCHESHSRPPAGHARTLPPRTYHRASSRRHIGGGRHALSRHGGGNRHRYRQWHRTCRSPISCGASPSSSRLASPFRFSPFRAASRRRSISPSPLASIFSKALRACVSISLPIFLITC